MVRGYLSANPDARLDDLLALKPADIEVEYELGDDD